MTFWIKFLLQQKEIRKQMNEYLVWRARRYPTTTQSHKEHLYRFAIQSGKVSVRDIQPEEIKEFIEGGNGEYQRQERAKVIHNFLTYHGMENLESIQESANLAEMKKTGRPADVEHIKLVKKLKDVNRLSFSQIQKHLLVTEKRLFQVSQIHGWYHYDLKKQMSPRTKVVHSAN